jgi:hypothetical protein
MAAKNWCRDCGHTWHPRGRMVSRVCPACKAGSVVYVEQTNPFAGCGTVLLILFGVSAVLTVALFIVIAVMSKPDKHPPTTAPDTGLTPAEEAAVAAAKAKQGQPKKIVPAPAPKASTAPHDAAAPLGSLGSPDAARP